MSATDGSVAWDELARAAARGADQGEAAEELQQLLTFALGDSPYALPVERVREIVRLRPTAPVPHVPADVLGVISLRGEIVPVIDLRCRLGLAAAPPGPRGRIVIVHSEDERIGGLLVDSVTEVLLVSRAAFQPPREDTNAVAALCPRGERFVSVLDLERVWSLDAER